MKKIKVFSFVLTVLANTCLYSQSIDDIGVKTFYEVKAMQDVEPCEVTIGRALTYCVSNGNKLSYIFENNRLKGIMFMTAFDTKIHAELELKKEVSDFYRRNEITPTYTNGITLFIIPKSKLTVTYEVKEYQGTYYLMYYTFLSD